jgi:hypothetical protein
MSFSSLTWGIFKRRKDQEIESEMSIKNIKNTEKNPKFNFALYGLMTTLLIAVVGVINWSIDPLWYHHGNILTGKNFAFNERISKTNLFLRTKATANYDCIILGSSRVITMKASSFTENRCFNYAMKGGETQDFVDYGQFIKEQGVNAKKVYIGVDGLNFVAAPKKKHTPFNIKNVATQSFAHAYLSIDVLTFSLMTLLNLSPDPANYYDRDFEPADFADPPIYKPDFYKPLEAQQCDLSKVKAFTQLKQTFPNAEVIGFVPPRSAWSIVNDTYGRNLTNCELQAFYQIGQVYDEMYDFSVPSSVTKNPEHTFDGSHYSVKINDRMAKILQGQTVTFGLKVNNYSFEQYRDLYLQEIYKFLSENDRLQYWREAKTYPVK